MSFLWPQTLPTQFTGHIILVDRVPGVLYTLASDSVAEPAMCLLVDPLDVEISVWIENSVSGLEGFLMQLIRLSVQYSTEVCCEMFKSWRAVKSCCPRAPLERSSEWNLVWAGRLGEATLTLWETQLDICIHSFKSICFYFFFFF